jgi:hypothetical protein
VVALLNDVDQPGAYPVAGIKLPFMEANSQKLGTNAQNFGRLICDLACQTATQGEAVG